jgi:hypothetical protein
LNNIIAFFKVSQKEVFHSNQGMLSEKMRRRKRIGKFEKEINPGI